MSVTTNPRNVTFDVQATKIECMHTISIPMPDQDTLSKMTGCIGSINDKAFTLFGRLYRRGTCYLNLIIIKGNHIDLDITYRPCGWADVDSDDVIAYADFSVFGFQLLTDNVAVGRVA